MIKKELQLKIEEILSKYGLFSPIHLSEHLGIKVKFIKDQDQSFAGAIKKFDEGVIIFVNENHGEKRKLFTIAHELGHFFLHSDDLNNGIISYRDSELYSKYDDKGRRKEEEANHFAAELLMPKDVFIAYYAKNTNLAPDKLVKKMSDFFGVSESAVRIRLNYLDLI